MQLLLNIESITVVQSNQDNIFLTFEDPKFIQGEYAPFNSDHISLKTAPNEAENVIRRLGWKGQINIIDQKGNETFIPSVLDSKISLASLIDSVTPPNRQKIPPPSVTSPSIEQLREWVYDGMAEATDGCQVEPDGVCEHGHRSWLLVQGLI